MISFIFKILIIVIINRIYTERTFVKLPEWKIQQNKELGEVYIKNYNKFKTILYRLKLSPEKQEDVIQQAFLSALNTKTKIEKVEQCMNRAVINAAFYLKKNKFEKKNSLFSNNFDQLTTQNPENILITKQESVKINQIVENLPEQQQKCVKLSVIDEETSPQISKKLGIAPDTVRTHWRLGLQKLKKSIKSWDIPDVYESEYFISSNEWD